MKICRPSKRNIFGFLISIIVNPICFAATARAFVRFSRKHYINMKFIAHIFHFLNDYIFHIQKFCAIIILVEHTYDHTCYASRYKQEMKCVCTGRSIIEFDIIYLREQAHYRARRGEWIRLNSVVPHTYVCRIPFQAQTSRA